MGYLSVKTREDDSLLARLRVTSDNLKHSLLRMREGPLSTRTAQKHKVPFPSLLFHYPVSPSTLCKPHTQYPPTHLEPPLPLPSPFHPCCREDDWEGSPAFLPVPLSPSLGP